MAEYKILTISDHIFVPSGVALQTRYIVEGLLKSRPGKYSFRCLGGAMKHQDYRVAKTQEFQDDLLVIPVDGYGNEQIIREIISNEKIDALYFMTDPRFYRLFV